MRVERVGSFSGGEDHVNGRGRDNPVAGEAIDELLIRGVVHTFTSGGPCGGVNHTFTGRPVVKRGSMARANARLWRDPDSNRPDDVPGGARMPIRADGETPGSNRSDR